MKEKRLLESKYANDTNFQWLEFVNAQDKNNSIMNVTELGITKVEIHLAQEGSYALAEKQEKISEEAGIKIDVFNKTQLNMKKANYASDGIFRHIKYEVHISSNNKTVDDQTFPLTADDMKYDAFHNPMFDITDKILAKGDYFSLDQNVVNKTQTTVRFFADREAIAIEAMKKSIEFYDEQKQIAEGKGGSYSEYDCEKYNLGDEELSLSAAEEAALETEIAADRAAKMQLFQNQYNSYNLAFLRAREDKQKELDEFAEQWRYDAHHKRVFGDAQADANTLISEK